MTKYRQNFFSFFYPCIIIIILKFEETKERKALQFIFSIA